MSYVADDAVQILWGNKWFAGRIVRVVDAASWEISYDGWAASWNEVVGSERLLRAGEQPPAPPPPPPKPPVVLDGPLAGADAVSWADLDHAYGVATDIPECLSALRSTHPKLRGDALAHLGNALDHQGIGRGPATLAATPFLVRLLGDRGVPDRAGIANLLADFAVGDTWWFLYWGFHPTEQTRPDHCTRPKASSRSSGGDRHSRGFPDPGPAMDMAPGHGLLELYDEVERGLPVYLAALADDDALVRASAAHVLAFLTRRASESCPLLANAVTADPDPAVRASCALGLSHAARFVPAEKARAIAVLIEAWSGAPSELERRAIAIALARHEEEAVTALVTPWLAELLERGVPAIAPAWPFPWRRLDSAELVFCTALFGTPPAHRPPIALAAARGLAAISDDDGACDVAARLAFMCLGPPQPGVVPQLADLDDDSRAVMRAIADAPRAWIYSELPQRLSGHSLPYTRDGLLAWLAG